MLPISRYATKVFRVAALFIFGVKNRPLDKLRPKLWSLCAVLEMYSAVAVGQSTEPLAVALEEIRIKHDLPGMIAGQFDTQRIHNLAAVGFRRSGSKDPLLTNHPMHLGSCTKSMTATLIAMAVDEGLLSWQSTLSQVFHDDPKVIASPWAEVTIEQLLHHTSGAPANPPWSEFADPAIAVRTHRMNVLHWWMQQPRKVDASDLSEPEFLYSNLGYMTLGAVLEKLRDEPWEAQIRKQLFEPLGMRGAGFGVPSKSLGDLVPWGHIRPLGILVAVEKDNPPALGPAGTVYADMEDWIKYLQLHLRGKAADTPGLKLSESSFEYLHKPQENQRYAGGWIVLRRSWSQGPIYHHNGSNTYWYCVVFLAPEEGRGIFAASNLGLESAGPCDQALQWMLVNLPFQPSEHASR